HTSAARPLGGSRIPSAEFPRPKRIAQLNRNPVSVRHARGRSLPLLFSSVPQRVTFLSVWMDGGGRRMSPVAVAGQAQSVPRRWIKGSSGRGRLPQALLLYGPPALPSAGRDGLPHDRNGWGRSVWTDLTAQAGEWSIRRPALSRRFLDGHGPDDRVHFSRI